MSYSVVEETVGNDLAHRVQDSLTMGEGKNSSNSASGSSSNEKTQDSSSSSGSVSQSHDDQVNQLKGGGESQTSNNDQSEGKLVSHDPSQSSLLSKSTNSSSSEISVGVSCTTSGVVNEAVAAAAAAAVLSECVADDNNDNDDTLKLSDADQPDVSKSSAEDEPVAELSSQAATSVSRKLCLPRPFRFKDRKVKDLDKVTEKPPSGRGSKSKPPPARQSWLLRLFESKMFDMSIAISYLFNSKEPGVQTYIGKKYLFGIFFSLFILQLFVVLCVFFAFVVFVLLLVIPSILKMPS
jgi:hypothetical protein